MAPTGYTFTLPPEERRHGRILPRSARVARRTVLVLLLLAAAVLVTLSRISPAAPAQPPARCSSFSNGQGGGWVCVQGG